MQLRSSTSKRYFNDTYSTFKTEAAENDHKTFFKDLVDCYECWVLLPDHCLYDTLVYKEDETIKIYRKDKLQQQPDILLESFAIPEDAVMGLVKVKEFDYAINIIMPKAFSDFAVLSSFYSKEL